MSEIVNRPIKGVWKVVTNFDNSVNLTKSASVFRQTSAGAMGVGAIVESRSTIFGRTLMLHMPAAAGRPEAELLLERRRGGVRIGDGDHDMVEALQHLMGRVARAAAGPGGGYHLRIA